MQFEQNSTIVDMGEKAGYIFSYLLFSTILFFALSLSKKLPSAWNYFHIMVIVAGITLAGVFLKRLLR